MGTTGMVRLPEPATARLVWLIFAALTFAAYLVLALTGSGDGVWIVGFVIVGWPTLAAGVAATIFVSRRGGSRGAPSFATVVALSLVAWGVAATALELIATTEYIAATLLSIVLPTGLGVAALFAIRGRTAIAQ